MKEKLEITEDTLHKLFKVYNIMDLIEVWREYDDLEKAKYLFDLLKKVKGRKK